MATQLSALDATRLETDTQTEDEAGKHVQMNPMAPHVLCSPRQETPVLSAFSPPKPDPGEGLLPPDDSGSQQGARVGLRGATRDGELTGKSTEALRHLEGRGSKEEDRPFPLTHAAISTADKCL